MFSADSIGVVIVWNSFIHPQVDKKRKRRGTGGKKSDQSNNRVHRQKLMLSYLSIS